MIFESAWQWGVPHNGRFTSTERIFFPSPFHPAMTIENSGKRMLNKLDIQLDLWYTTGFMVYNWIYLICGIVFGQTWGIDGKPQDFVQRVFEYIAILLRRG